MMRTYFTKYIIEKIEKEKGEEGAANSIISEIFRKYNLPTIPQIYVKLLKSIDSGEEGLKELSDLIKIDPALSFIVMDTAYSAGYRDIKPIINIEGAVAAIGIDVVKSIVSYASTDALFESGKTDTSFDLMQFWEHSLKCAFLSQIISKELHYNYHEEAFVAGLLHDLGKLVLFKSFPDKYNRILATYRDTEGPIHSEEDKAIGMDHCMTGALLIDKWGYHSFMADAIFYHHHPLEKIANASPLVKIIHVANLLAERSQDNGKKYQTAEELFEFSSDQSDRYLAESETRFREKISRLGLEGASTGFPRGDSGYGFGIVGELLDEVRDSSFLAGVLHALSRAENRDALLMSVKQGLQVMVGIADIALFLYNSQEEALLVHRDGGDDYSAIMEDLYVPLNLEKSILVTSLLKKAPTDSFSYSEYMEIEILDSQIIHSMGKEGIFCLPMLEKSKFIGVIVLGIDRVQLPCLSGRKKLLERFVRQTSSALYAEQIRQNQLHRYHADRLESAVLRAKKIVHEINNPLSIIKNYLKVLGMRLTESNIAHDEIQIVNEEINRIGGMLRTLSGPTVRDARIKEPVDVNTLISDLVRLTIGSFTKQSGIEIHLDTDASIPAVMIHKDSLKQVLLNLIKNAMEAMPDGGNISIKTLYVPNPVIDGQKSTEGGSPGLFEIIITDDGPGIPEDSKKVLYDPFVTSREGHDGLGLSIVSDLVNRMNGSIICESDRGKGTSFKIQLPLTDY